MVCATLNTYGQEANIKLLQKLVEKQVLTEAEAEEILQEELAQQEEQKESTDKIDEVAQRVRNVFGNTPYLKINGYGLFTYKYRNDVKNHNNAEPRVIFLWAQGQLTKTFSYMFMGELVDPLIYEFYGDWTPTKEFKLRVGQQKTPFSLENPISLTALETIYYTRSISSLVAMADDVTKLQNGKNNTGRDIGIQAYGSLLPMGDHDFILYNIGLYQGSGLVSSDQNNTKDLVGTVMLQPVKGWRISGGAYFGEATYKLDNEEFAKDHVRNRWALSSDYKTDRINARVEWLHGNDGGIKKEGLYGSALYYFIPKKFNAVLKADYFNKNKDIQAEVVDYTAGVNYYFYNECRFQLNYTYLDYSKKWDAKNSHLFAAQMQIVF